MEKDHQAAAGSYCDHCGIAEVRLKQKNKRIDLPYDYLIPPDLKEKAVPGVRVVVPFGNGSRLLEGFIETVKAESLYGDELKSVCAVIDDAPVLTAVQLALCRWMHRYYGALFYETLTLFTAPVKVIRRQKKNASEPCFEAYCPKRTPKAASDRKRETDIEDQLLSHGDLSGADWMRTFFQSEEPCFFECISQHRRFDTYFQLAEQVRQRHGQTLVLLPESFGFYGLKPAFDAFFGSSGSIYSSELKPAERYDIFKQVQQGTVSVVLGTRAALFLPYADLELIIIDEPDDNAYFARSMPRYDTLRVAQAYSRIGGIRIFLGGSALPLQIYYGISQQHIRHIQNAEGDFPHFETVDMQSEMRRGNLDFISGLLKQRMEETILRGEKVLLMLNRRGLASYMLCRQCGHVEKCSHCGISLKPHADGKLRCPYCGETKSQPDRCPLCHSIRFKPVGLGIEKAAEVLKNRYPGWRILQLDAQMIADEEGLSEIRSRLDSGNWDVVVGTRVLLKGWQFQSVGLAAALLMDEAFNHGDYNDSEKAALLFRRFFALSEKYAIGQTYEPNHEVIEMLSGSDTAAFYENEIAYRKIMHYPPMCHLVLFSVMDQSEIQAGQDAESLYRCLSGFHRKMPAGQFFQIYQPVLAGVQPKTGRIRFKIMLKISQTALFQQILAALITAGELEKLKSRISIAVDPGETV